MDNSLAAKVKLGMDAEKFVSSEIGQYLLKRAASESLAALEQMKTIDPTDAKTISKLQNNCKRFDELQQWLKEAINDGDMAYNHIVSDNEYDLSEETGNG